jgi:16S rRNA (adenine1518-N6/adenine1519-N6)-dimethyltransferase
MTVKHDQHFLKDEKILNEIITAAELKQDDIILEIGPGKGVLTEELAKKAKKVMAIEMDDNLKPWLDALPANVEVIYSNALDLMPKASFSKIVANIPYAISEPLLKELIKKEFEVAVLLIGKNFYELLTGDAGKKTNNQEKTSKWAIITPLFFDIEKIVDVPRSCFEPEPRTDSVLVRLKKRKSQLSPKEQMLKELILQDDKKLINALITGFARIGKLTQKQAKEKVSDLKLAENLLDKRVEHLSNRQFMAVYCKINMQK